MHPTLSEAANIFVMVDEAHRTQYKSLAANMRRALPNACFLGFTGTPIDKKDRSTLRTFGPYIDTYTIEQAVRDKATVPIFYESRLPELQIIGQTLDQVFDRVFADRGDDERAAIRQRFATEQAVAGAPRRIEAVCLDLIDHFTRFIAPNGFKAQVVASSRHAAVTFKETLDRLNGPESALIMSAGHNDEARLARWHLRKDEQDRAIERFKDRDDPLSILVVCDMLLTGFDAPVEQVLYLDAPLKEHTLLQAVARVNRPLGEEKTYGLVVDYWGVSAKLQDALAVFSTTDVQGALTPNVDELPRLESRHAAAMKFFGQVADKDDLDACVRVLEPEDVRAGFDLAFRRFGRSMDMLLPDPRALSYHADLRWLGKVRGAARARYRDDRLDVSGCGEKVRALIADAVAADGIQILVKEVQLFSPEFDEKVDALATDEAKASEMEHAIRHEITVRAEENPAFRRSARRKKTVAVTVDPGGSVLVVAPVRLAGTRLDEIVTRKAPWIVQRLRRAESDGPPPAPREFVSGESVLYLGRHYRLKVHSRDSSGAAPARLRGGWLHVPPRQARGRPRGCAPPSSPGSGATRPSGCPSASRRGARRPASRRPASSSPTSGSAGEAATTAAPSA